VTLKALERNWKALSLRAVCLALGSLRSPGPLPGWGRVSTRVLFLRQDRIGDAIVSSGVLRALKNVPGMAIDVLASPTNAPALRRDPSVDRVHVFDKRRPGSFTGLARRLREIGYDAVIDCMVTAPSMTGVLLMLASGAPHRIGIAGRGVDAALTLPVQPVRGAEHIIDLLSALLEPFGIDRSTVDLRPSLQLNAAERAAGAARWERVGGGDGRRLLVNLSAGRPDRSWRDEHFIAAVRHLLARFPELRVGVVGAPAELPRVRNVADASGAVPLETPTLDDVIALVATTDLVFTPDTSIAHMAFAFERPALVMYRSPEAAAQWGPYRSPGISLVSPGESLVELPLQQVLPELERLVGGTLADTGRAAGIRNEDEPPASSLP